MLPLVKCRTRCVIPHHVPKCGGRTGVPVDILSRLKAQDSYSAVQAAQSSS